MTRPAEREADMPGTPPETGSEESRASRRKIQASEKENMDIIFATNNAHKLTEVQAVLGPGYKLLTPRDCGVTEEIPEEQDTLEGNASQKAHYLHERTGMECFADDTGL